jgi:ABC-type Fe3+ transport system permease subunit
VGVLVICVLVFIVFCIVSSVSFMYIYSCVLSVLVLGLLPPTENSITVVAAAAAAVVVVVVMFPLRSRLHPSASPAVHHIAVILPLDAISCKMLTVRSK